MLFRTQIIFCSSELRLHFRIAEVGSLLSLNRAWRAQVTHGFCLNDNFARFCAINVDLHQSMVESCSLAELNQWKCNESVYRYRIRH